MDMGTGLVLSAELMDKIDDVLAELLNKAQASYIILADISGQLISKIGKKRNLDPTIISALTASNMAATTEIAKQVGEKVPFKMVFHEGEKHNIYLSGVGSSFLLAVVFEVSVQIGLVRLYTKEAGKKLLPLAEKFEGLQQSTGQMIDDEFNDALAAELDGLSNEKS